MSLSDGQIERMVERLERMANRSDQKLDVVIETLAAVREETRVHAAVCDVDRADLRKDAGGLTVKVQANSVRLWKLAIALVGSGAVGASAVEAAKALFTAG